MKFTMTTIFAAALATLSSAAALPADSAVTAATVLPAKFTLNFTTPISTSPVKKFEGPIRIDSYFGRILQLGPGSSQSQYIAIFNGKDNEVATVPDVEFNITRTLLIYTGGDAVLWYTVDSGYPPSTLVKSGFVQANGLLSVDLKDGKGPQSTWKACPDMYSNGLWNIHWGASTTVANCVAVDLHIVAA